MKAAPRMHRPLPEDDIDPGPTLSMEDAEQVVDLIRIALGSLIDPHDAETEDITEFWFADFPVVVEFCPGCATVTIQILGNEISSAHVALGVLETLREIVQSEDPEDLVALTVRREPLGEGLPLYVTRIAYPVALPEVDPTWAMVAELVNVFDHLFGVFVAGSSRDAAPE